MNENNKLEVLYNAFMDDESVCTSCHLRMLILEAIEDLMVEE
jgi:hypothetical protein